MIKLKARRVNTGAEIPWIVPVGEAKADTTFAGDRGCNPIIECREVQCFFCAKRMARRADSLRIHFGKRRKHIDCCLRVIKHFPHAQRARVSFLKIGGSFGVPQRSVMPQEAFRAEHHEALARELQP